MIKYEIPMQMLAIIEKYAPASKDLPFKAKKKDGFIFYFVPKYEGSPFFFGVKDISGDGEVKANIAMRPESQIHAGQVAFDKITLKDFDIYIAEWIRNIAFYNKPSILDDKILADLTENYFEDFELTDDPSNQKALTGKQILLLDNQIEAIEAKIKELTTPENEPVMVDILQASNEVRESLTSEDKISVFKKLSLLYGKVTRAGVKIMKETLTEVVKDQIKQLVTNPHKLIEIAHDVTQNL